MNDDYTQQGPVQPHTYTFIEDVGYVCNDCGAWAETEEEVTHQPTCRPGESARWQKFYEEAPIDDEGNPAWDEEIPDGPDVA